MRPKNATETGRVVLPGLPPPLVHPVADVEPRARVGAGVRPADLDLADQRVGHGDRADLDPAGHPLRAMERAVVVVGAGGGADREVDRPVGEAAG